MYGSLLITTGCLELFLVRHRFEDYVTGLGIVSSLLPNVRSVEQFPNPLNTTGVVR